MPSFYDSTTAAAPPEEVWKILHDPSRFEQWWAGADHPEYPLPQRTRTISADRRIVLSCMATHARLEWQLEPHDGGAATRIDVHVDLPADQAQLLDLERRIVRESLHRLARLATPSSPPV